MCDSEMLREYGLLGAFDTMINMMGEQLALITGPGRVREPKEPSLGEDLDSGTEEKEQEEEQGEEEEEEEEEEDEEIEGMTYAELQFHSQALATHLFYRFGVRSGDRVLLGTSGSTAAELAGMIACMRLGATFVPLDLDGIVAEQTGGFPQASKERLQSIIAECSPSAAILVAEDDSSPSVLLLASLGVFRCALLRLSGSLVEDDDATLTTPLIDTLCDVTSSSSTSPIPDQPLYILFTSGSTGTPKGVLGTHRGLVNRLCWQYDRFPYSADEVTLRRTPLTFVDSLSEMFAPLLAGVPQCCFLMATVNTEGLAAIALPAQQVGVTRITVLPSLLSQACRLDPALPQHWPALRLVIVSGEDCPQSVVQAFRALFGSASQLVNLYGSTEVAGDVTWAVLSGEGEEEGDGEGEGEGGVSIGRPLPGNFLFLVHAGRDDEDDEDEEEDKEEEELRLLSTLSEEGDIVPLPLPLPLPLSCTAREKAAPLMGEAVVLGEHVAAGYLPASYNRRRFVCNPFLCPATRALLPPRWRDVVAAYPLAFRTGDVVELRRPPRVGLVYRGRRDRLVKVHGQRVDLDDVERRLRTCLRGAEGLAVLSLPPPQGGGVALVLDRDALRPCLPPHKDVHHSDVRHFLLQRLAPGGGMHALVSTAWIALVPAQALPRTPSYKLDRRRLLADLVQTLDTWTSGPPSTEADPVQTLDTWTSGPPSTEADPGARTAGGEEAMADLAAIEQRVLAVYRTVLPAAAAAAACFPPPSQAFFFQLGGDSMTAMEALWRLRQAFPTAQTAGALPAHCLRGSVSQLARHLLRGTPDPGQDRIRDAGGLSPPPVAKKRSRGASPPLSSSSSDGGDGCRRAVRCVAAFSRGQSPPSEERGGGGRGGEEGRGRLQPRWQVRLDKCVDASPLVCKVHTQAPQAPQAAPSPASSATAGSVSEVWVLVGSHAGDVHCVRDLGDAGVVPVWRREIAQHTEGHMVCSLRHGLVYVSAYQAHDRHTAVASLPSPPPPRGGSLWALALASGDVVWRQATQADCKAPPVVSLRWNRVFQGDYAGRILGYGAATGAREVAVEVDGSVFAAPVFTPCEQWLCVATLGGQVSVLHCTADTVVCAYRWCTDCPLFSTPVVVPRGTNETDEALVCAGIDGCVRCLVWPADPPSPVPWGDVSPLRVRWEVHCAHGPFFSSPCLLPGRVAVVVGCHDGHLRKLDVRSGRLVSDLALHTAVYSSPVFVPQGTDAREGGRLVCATTAGDVCVVGGVAQEGGEMFVERTVRLPAEVFSSPVVYGDAVYVGCRDDHLYCLQL